MIPLRSRLRDWLADRCKWVQYSVPRRSIRERTYGRMLKDLVVQFALLALSVAAVAGWLYEHRGRRGELPLLILFTAALLAWASDKMFVFLF